MQQVDARLNEWQGALDGINGITLTDPRTAVTNLAAANSEVLVDLNGKATVTFDVTSIVAPANADLVIEGTVDGTNYRALSFWVQFSTIGSLPAETVNVAISPTAPTAGQVCIVTASCTGFRRVRMRKISATGNVNVSLRASVADLRIIAQPQPAVSGSSITILNSAAAAALIAAPTAGLFQYLTALHVSIGCTAALAAAVATPTLTLSNIPGLVFQIPTPITALGVYQLVADRQFANPIKATAAATVINATMSAAVAGITVRINAHSYNGA